MNENLVDDILVESDIGFITSQDIEKSINDFESSLNDPGILYINGHKSFNLLLRYIYKHNIKHILPNTYNNDYELLDQIFINIYINLCYRYNRIPSISCFCINLVFIDYGNVYDLKIGTYRSTGDKVNINTKRIVEKWTRICDGELIDNVTHTGNIGAMFVAKTRGFREEPQTIVMIDTHAPRIDAKQISDVIGKLPELPE